MKKILFLANHFITLYSFRKELIKSLLNEGVEVYLSLPEDSDNKYFEDLGCKIVKTPIDRRGVNPLKDLRLILFYRKMISKINPSIIFSYTIKPNIYGCLAHGKKYRQICNITGTGATFLGNNFLSACCKALYKMSVKKAYKVFFQNTGDRDFFIENGMIGSNYEMLPGSGCDVEQYTYSPMPNDGVIRFIYIGRVMKLKGVDEYLEAAKVIKSKYSNVEFLIAGWNEEEAYKNKVAEYQQKGYVKYIGFRKDIKDWLVKVDCVVLASHGGEGVPNVLLEGAATGRVCIGSNINGTKDVIEDGVTGYLFEAGDSVGLINKIEVYMGLSQAEKEEMGKTGRNKVVREFDRKVVIQKYMDEVQKI